MVPAPFRSKENPSRMADENPYEAIAKVFAEVRAATRR